MARHIIRVESAKAPLNRKLTLENLQKSVGGIIELIFIDSTTLMIINQEGLILGLPRNRIASRMANRTIVGDVVVLTDSDKKDYMRSDI